MNRRALIKKGMQAASALSFTSLDELAASQIPNSKFNDPHGYLQYLHDGEYIVPDNIIDVYSRITSPDIKKPQGLYLIDVSLDTEGKKQEFRNELQKLCYSREEINQYLTIFTTPGNILLKESGLEGLIREWLPHERFHREVHSLSSPDYEELNRVAKQMLDRYYSVEEAEKAGDLFDQREIYLKREFIPKLQAIIRDIEKRGQLDPKRKSRALGIPLVENIDMSNDVRFSSERSILEFYPYLAGGKFKPRAEAVLRRDFPTAHYLFDEIRKRTQDIANYNPRLPPARSPNN